MEKIYFNRGTGEITENHRIAVEWYRDGYEIEIRINGELMLVWEH